MMKEIKSKIDDSLLALPEGSRAYVWSNIIDLISELQKDFANAIVERAKEKSISLDLDPDDGSSTGYSGVFVDFRQLQQIIDLLLKDK